MVSARDTFENLIFTARFRVEHQTDFDPHEWDGIHLFLKYRDETGLYYVTVARRDGIAAIKRKVTGGPSNGGTYETLAQTVGGAVIRPGEWVTAQGRIVTTPEGVLIEMALDGQPVVAVMDRGELGELLTGPGRVGVRGDNTEFTLDDLSVVPER